MMEMSWKLDNVEDNFLEDLLLDICQPPFHPNLIINSGVTSQPAAVSVPTQQCTDKSLQEALIHIHHAQSCGDSNAKPPRPCRVSRRCLETVQLLQHISHCPNRTTWCSTTPDCVRTHMLMEHFLACSTMTCSLCLPLNQTIQRKRSRLGVIIVNRRKTPNNKQAATSAPVDASLTKAPIQEEVSLMPPLIHVDNAPANAKHVLYQPQEQAAASAFSSPTLAVSSAVHYYPHQQIQAAYHHHRFMQPSVENKQESNTFPHYAYMMGTDGLATMSTPVFHPPPLAVPQLLTSIPCPLQVPVYPVPPSSSTQPCSIGLSTNNTNMYLPHGYYQTI